MKLDDLVTELGKSNSFDEKSGLLADAVISRIGPPVADIALMCGLIHWFNEGVIKRLLNESYQAEDTINTILSLPFVEVRGSGFVFHNSTRSGLLLLYRRQPEKIVEAYSKALPELLNDLDNDDDAAIAVAYGLIATNDSRTDDMVSSLVGRFIAKYQINTLKIFVEEIKEVLWLSNEKIFSPKRWIQIGWLQFANGKFNDVISSCEQALRVDPGSEEALLLRATTKKVESDFDSALSDLNEVISIN
ncbi:MAG: hypothetical protein EHM20_17340, partial [Alphaproteobacteria bacterium]